MATTPPLFPISGNSHFDHFGFDPELDYAQVLAEARTHNQTGIPLQLPTPKASNGHNSRALRRPDLVADISCFSAHFKPAELQKSLEDLKTRRSWKNSLFFWRRSQKKHKRAVSGIPTPQHPVFKSRSRPTSGPIYTNEFLFTPPCRSSRSNSGPLADMLTPTRRGDAEIPYMSLNHHNHTRVTPPTPIYLVT